MMLRALLLISIAAALTACQRPFSEPARPRVDVLQPDLTVIQKERQMQLAIRVSAAVGIEEVIAEDDTLTYDADENAWRGEHVVFNGLNRIVLSVTDADMRRTFDTLYAFADVLTTARSTPHLPGPRGGHTATRLEDGSIVIIGGAPRAGEDALDSALLLREGGAEFIPMSGRLNVARTGHAATLLPDGRILILGGSTRDAVESIDDLVETVEVYDPSDQGFDIVDVDGESIRRAHHTATLHLEDGELFVDLYGGLGDVNYQPPIFGTRADVRRFALRGDSLVALDPAPGPTLKSMIFGHSQVELYPDTPDRRYIVSGTFFANSQQEVSFELEYDRELGLVQHPVDVLHTSRTRHAAVLLHDGFVGIFGGRQTSPQQTLNLTEIYSSRARRYFRYPDTDTVLSRYGHTATKVRNRRILLLGGFLPSGQGAVTSELYQTPAFQADLSGAARR